MQTYTRSSSGSFLSEEYIQDAFHSYLKSSLTQARIEKLLDTDVLSSAEGDLMITGPALCLYFAALRCTTNPPSVPLPRRRKNSNGTSTASTPTDLSTENCPPAFRSFLSVWARCVPPIQALTPEHQHDLARIICGLDPLTVTISEDVYGIAADLRAVAIEISQRRSFQDRYASDLQAALDGGGVPSISSSNPSPSFKASFVPPPSYEDVQHNSPSPSPTSSAYSSAQSSPNAQVINLPPQDSSPIDIIRETLYAALADVLSTHASLRALLKLDPPRAYFGSVALAILDVAWGSVREEEVTVIGVLGTSLTLTSCPTDLKPFMIELGGIAKEVRKMREEDDERVIRALQEGREPPNTLPRYERVRAVLEEGVGGRSDLERAGAGRSRSPSGRAVAFANRINALALGMTRLKAFRERQGEVFRVLAAASASGGSDG
ncbi:hypothetical protein K435DRAFT_695784 [Dendrothele bispora CBS 962.96]|uniref:Uncharacterized protein n=1 Tax=Dendrothele bispora (strain CBS 962.96) TaxID=1314807 RepID=A0A4S8KWY4_DENBC|nr:hypothetical protein K435DRAFT_695784 [Dendrothele bispora CBS 962.96]